MKIFSASLALGLMLGGAAAIANPMVGGAAMYSTRNIVQNAVNSKDHTTLVAAVKAASLVDTLSGKGPFTVFAPTDAAFAKLPAGTVETLVKPENKAMLTKILTYHVVPGSDHRRADRCDGRARPWHSDPENRRGRKPALQEERQRLGGRRCEGRPLTDHDRERHAVERRDPCRRHRADAVTLLALGKPDAAERNIPAGSGRPHPGFGRLPLVT